MMMFSLSYAAVKEAEWTGAKWSQTWKMVMEQRECSPGSVRQMFREEIPTDVCVACEMSGICFGGGGGCFLISLITACACHLRDDKPQPRTNELPRETGDSTGTVYVS